MKLRSFVLTTCLALAGCAAAGAPVVRGDAVDFQCKVDSDCAVKDVGNCCGYFPACTNRDSATFPDRVRASCQKTGTAGVCGFADIQACRCVQHRCEATSDDTPTHP